MPTKPGVYVYKDSSQAILYVGKAKNLRNRVRSYFQPPIKLSPKTAMLVSNIASIEHIEVASEIEALLLESQLIKKFKPFYNIASKDDKSPYYIHITKELFPKPTVNHEPSNAIAGPFLSGYTARSILKHFRRITPYCLAKHPGRACLYSHLNLCNPCPNAHPTKVGEYGQNIARLKKLLTGHFKAVHSQLKSDMLSASKSGNFEQAALYRDQIKSLDYLLTTPVTPDDYFVNPNLIADLRQEAVDSLKFALSKVGLNLASLARIELFDNAHLAGVAPTSAMTVAVSGELDSKFYRHFTIKQAQSTSDVAMMQEVLTRRLKRSDWPTPDLIVLDGGKSQLSILESISTSIPVIALAKRDETLIIPTNSKFIELNLPRTHPGLKLLMHLRDEAHRFSRRLHHKHRRIIMK